MLRCLKDGDVAPALVVVIRHVRRVHRERVIDVGVLGPLAEALQLPHAGDLDELPLLVVEIGPVEVAGPLEGARRQVESPGAGEQRGTGALHVPRQGVRLGVVDVEVTPRREGIAVYDFEIVPVRGIVRLYM